MVISYFVTLSNINVTDIKKIAQIEGQNLTDEDINKINNYTMTHSFIDSYELYHSKNFK